MPLGSYIKGHYTDGVSNPQDYPLCGIGAANVGPEFTMSEYDGLAELERTEQKLLAEGRIAMRSRITETLERLVEASGRWKKWLLPAEEGSAFGALSAERRTWLVKTGCRYIWQEPEALVARQRLYDNLRRVGMDPKRWYSAASNTIWTSISTHSIWSTLTTCCNERKRTVEKMPARPDGRAGDQFL